MHGDTYLRPFINSPIYAARDHLSSQNLFEIKLTVYQTRSHLTGYNLKWNLCCFTLLDEL